MPVMLVEAEGIEPSQARVLPGQMRCAAFRRPRRLSIVIRIDAELVAGLMH